MSDQGFPKITSSRSGDTVAPIGLPSSAPNAPEPTTFIHQIVLRYATHNAKATSNDAARWIMGCIKEASPEEVDRVKIVEAYEVKQVLQIKRSYIEDMSTGKTEVLMEGEKVERVSPHSDTQANQ